MGVKVLLCLLAVSMGCNEIQCDDSVKHLSVALGIFLLVLLSFFFLLAWIGAIYSPWANKPPISGLGIPNHNTTTWSRPVRTSENWYKYLFFKGHAPFLRI